MIQAAPPAPHQRAGPVPEAGSLARLERQTDRPRGRGGGGAHALSPCAWLLALQESRTLWSHRSHTEARCNCQEAYRPLAERAQGAQLCPPPPLGSSPAPGVEQGAARPWLRIWTTFASKASGPIAVQPRAQQVPNIDSLIRQIFTGHRLLARHRSKPWGCSRGGKSPCLDGAPWAGQAVWKAMSALYKAPDRSEAGRPLRRGVRRAASTAERG